MPRPARARVRDYFGDLARALRELPALRRFIAADVVGVTAMVTIVFYARAAIERDGFREALAGQWVMIGAASQMGLCGLIILAGERVRPRAWLAIGLVAASAGALFAAHGGTALFYASSAGCMGLWVAARNSCHGPQVMRLAPGRDGTAPIGLATGIAMPIAGLAPYIGGLLIPGVGYAPVFWAVAASGILSALLILRWVPPGGPPRARVDN